MKVDLKGFREMDAALEEFRKPTGQNILKRAGIAALEPMAEVMEAKAPRLSGDLEKAVGVGTRRPKGAKKHFRDRSTVEIYAGVKVVGGGMPPQAIQQEFGNENHGPQPYVRPGWDAEKMPTLDRVADTLGGEIDKAQARAKRKALKAGR